uniref:PAP2_C domain-containing protein n=1 Tax=Syphacia muris TaxID=451379 RepID=A0A0N5ANJ0_9BILA
MKKVPYADAVKPWRGEVEKTVVAFCLMLLSAFLNFFLLTLIHDIVPRKSLPDIVFMVIPQQRWAWAVGDVFSTISSVVGFTCVFLHAKRLVVLRRLLLLGAITYGLRAVVMSVTFLPPSFEHKDEICLPQVNRTTMYAMEVASRFITYVVTLGLTSGQDKILCGDLMFSGHTVVLSLMYFVQLYYTPKGLNWLRWLAAPILILGVAALVVSGGHYTMDVLIAYWLTSHIFYAYHQIFEMPSSQRNSAPLSKLWWYHLCWWFEKDVPEGRIVNQWDWPFSRPIFLRGFISQLNTRLQ